MEGRTDLSQSHEEEPSHSETFGTAEIWQQSCSSAGEAFKSGVDGHALEQTNYVLEESGINKHPLERQLG